MADLVDWQNPTKYGHCFDFVYQANKCPLVWPYIQFPNQED